MTLEELYKILLSDDVIEKIKEHEQEIFEMIPELETCKGFKQNNPWHVYDVYEHILRVVEGVPKEKQIRLAALFHDVGKPQCHTTDSEGIDHFKGHWKYSLRFFLEFANNYYVDVNTVSLVSKLVFYHDYRFKNDDDTKIKVITDNFDDNELKQLYDLKRADLLAQNSDYHYLLDELNKQEELVLKRHKR